MEMKRDIYHKLLEWKTSLNRKPLVLNGARQTGKTHLLKAFGKAEYEHILYCNFEENPRLRQFFIRHLSPRRILAELSLYFNEKIRPGTSLLIFDEVQTADRVFQSLGDFAKEVPDFHMIATRSFSSFPSLFEHIDLLNLYPMTFPEFLDAMGETRLRRSLENNPDISPLTETFHDNLNTLFNQYMIVGGMPQAVRHFADTRNATEVRSIQKDILKSYLLDVATYAPASDIHKITALWESIPAQLLKQNSKFMFSAVKKTARMREYEKAMKWLEHAGLIHRAYAVQESASSLESIADHNAFKVYMLDIGLLGAIADAPVEGNVRGGPLFSRFSNGFITNYAAQQLSACTGSVLYYWKSRGGKAELDFLYEHTGQVYPVDIHTGLNTKSKRLQSYIQQFNPPLSIRSDLENFKADGTIYNFPLYAISLLPQFISQWHNGKIN